MHHKNKWHFKEKDRDETVTNTIFPTGTLFMAKAGECGSCISITVELVDEGISEEKKQALLRKKLI